MQYFYIYHCYVQENYLYLDFYMENPFKSRWPLNTDIVVYTALWLFGSRLIWTSFGSGWSCEEPSLYQKWTVYPVDILFLMAGICLIFSKQINLPNPNFHIIITCIWQGEGEVFGGYVEWQENQCHCCVTSNKAPVLILLSLHHPVY